MPDIADYLFEERHDAECEAAIGWIDLRIFMPQMRGDGIYLGLSLLDGNTRLQLADDVVVFMIAILRRIGRHRER